MSQEVRLKIFRFDPASGEPPQYVDYRVPLTDNLTVNQALFHLAARDDDPPAFRRFACNRGQCAGCVMTVNGRTARACTTPVREGQVLEPLYDYPVIRDLVVDFGTRVADGRGGFHLVRTGSLVLPSKSRSRSGGRSRSDLTGPWVKMWVDQERCDDCPDKPCLEACWVNRIGHLEDRWGYRLAPLSAPIRLRKGRAELAGICNVCSTRPCQAKCPAQAFQKVAHGAGLRILPHRCIGCGLCLTACDQGNIWLNLERGRAVKCDLCGGEPECVRACPFEAIHFRLVGGD